MPLPSELLGEGEEPSPTPTPTGELPEPEEEKQTESVIARICGEANKLIFVGFTDLFQQIVCFFIPPLPVIDILETIFNDTFDRLQEAMKPFAYNQGVDMGEHIQTSIEQWIRKTFDEAMSELNDLKNQALGEIDRAQSELVEHAEKIQNLIERVNQLESGGILARLGI